MASAACRPETAAVAISDPNRATPTALPDWRIVLSVPDATPDRERSTLPSISEVITGTTKPAPKPSSDSGTTIARYAVEALTSSKPAQAQPASRDPMAIVRRGPSHPVQRPAVRLAAVIATMIGAR